MSLPAGQQRVLDGIAEALRMTEPRLASMFAIFTRLAKNEPPPCREQLTATGPPPWVIALRPRLPRQHVVGGRRTRRLMLFISQMAIAGVVLVALMGLTTHATARCRGVPRPRVAASASRQACMAPAVRDAEPAGK